MEEDSPALKDCINRSIQRIEEYIKKSKERLITAASNSNDSLRSKRKTIKTRRPKWKEKQLYRYFKRQTVDSPYEERWTCLRKENLKKESESLNSSTKRTNHIIAKIDNTQHNSKCWLCEEIGETVNHISESSKLAHKEYKIMCQGYPIGNV